MRGNVLNTLLQVCLQDLNWLQYLVSYCLYYVLKDKTSENSAKKGAYLNAYFWHFWTLAPLLLCVQIDDKQNTTFQFSVKIISNKIHEATFKLVLTQRQHVDRSYLVVATNYWWIVGNF